MQRPVLVGEYDFTLDAKNRIAVPARLRAAFAEGIYVTRGHERCLAAYAPEEFERHLEEQTLQSSLSSKQRALQRFAAASAVFQEELDRQGRVTLPARLLEFAGITARGDRDRGPGPRRDLGPHGLGGLPVPAGGGGRCYRRRACNFVSTRWPSLTPRSFSTS